MQKRGLFEKIFGNKNDKKMYTQLKMLSSSNSWAPWDGNIFNNDIVRSCIRPKSSAVGKLKPIHLRTDKNDDIKVNPNPQIKFILRYPNEYMSMQKLLEKLVIQRELTNNAFAFVKRDELFKPIGIYPIPTTQVELLEYQNQIYAKFRFSNGKSITVPYSDVIHLKKDYNDNDFYGSNNKNALDNIIEVLDTTDKGIVKTIKNSSIIKWLMKFKTPLKPEDKQKEIDTFTSSYLDIEKNGTSIASVDPRYDIDQVKNDNYVPNENLIDKYEKRLKNYFGISDDIIKNNFTENQWNSFFEAEIEPIAKELSDQFTKTLFTKHEIECGNEIVFSASSLEFSSMQSKLNLKEMVDRGAMNVNEWRRVMNLSATEFGDEFIRRLDTAPINDKDENKIEGDDGNNEK